MAKSNTKHLVLLLLVITWLAWPVVVAAQDGSCPGGSYTLTRPQGTWPDDLDICGYDVNYISVEDDPSNNYPCDQYIEADQQDWQSDGVTISFVPEPVTGWGHYIRVNFLYWGAETIWPPVPSNVTLRAEYITAGGEVYSTAIMPISDFPRSSQFTGWVYYDVYVIDFYLPTPHDFDDPVTGYVRLNFDDDENLPLVYVFVKLASVHVGWLAYSPEHCPLPFGDLPATPTLVPWPTETATLPPTWTPTGTYYPPTSTPTWTPGPTAIGGTVTPLPTPTPLIFPTAPAENTPTRMPTVVLPTIAFPTIDFPNVAAAAANQPEQNNLVAVPDIAGPIEMVATQWSDVINKSFDQLVITNTIGITTASGAVAYLISPPTPEAGDYEQYLPAAVQDATNSMASVISFVKSIQLYLPTMWPTIYALLAGVSIIIFTIVVKFAVHWAVIILEWIRRIWEAIPLN